MRKRKAQSILEYILVLSAVILAVIAATVGIGNTGAGAGGAATGNTASGGVVMTAVTDMYDDATGLMQRSTGDFLNLGAGGYYSSNSSNSTP